MRVTMKSPDFENLEFMRKLDPRSRSVHLQTVAQLLKGPPTGIEIEICILPHVHFRIIHWRTWDAKTLLKH